VFFIIKAEHGEDDDNGYMAAQTTIYCPPHVRLAPVTVSYSRRLFKESLTQGVFVASTGPNPFVNVEIITPSLIWLGDILPQKVGPGTALEDGNAILRRTLGVTFLGIATTLKAGWSLMYSRLSTELKLDLQVNLISGLAGVLTGSWGTKENRVTTAVSLSGGGVEFSVECVELVVVRHNEKATNCREGCTIWVNVCRSP
jgi:DnaJ homolog subfamily C member 11